VTTSLRHHGSDAFGRLIGQNIEQARYLAGLIDAETETLIDGRFAIRVAITNHGSRRVDSALGFRQPGTEDPHEMCRGRRSRLGPGVRQVVLHGRVRQPSR